jgi:hypothetical protein
MAMHAVVRNYSGTGARELFDVLEKSKGEVEREMRSVKGFVSYTLARSADGGFSMTICQDEAGAEESVKRARDWVAKNAKGVSVGAPSVSEGTVIVHAK